MAREILIVDDNDAIRIFVRETLEEAGMRVTEADSGAKALEILRTRSFDVMITDLTMPKMGGVELILATHGLPHLEKMPIVVMTAETEDESDRLFSTGARAFLTKPFDGARLLDTIARL